MKSKKSKNSFRFIAGVVLSMTFGSSVHAQVEPGSLGYYSYVPTFGSQTVYGSARMQGLAGSGVSLGGDIGQIGLNPASLGFFRKSELSISAAVGSNGSKSSFLGNSMNANRTWFGLPNFGMVINFSKDDIVPGIFRGGSLGISFTKTNNFQQQIAMSGVNSQNSLTDYFVENANNGLASGRTFQDVSNEDYTMPNSLDALAYNTYLIDYNDSTNSYSASVGHNNGSTYVNGPSFYDFQYDQAAQKQTITRKGGQYSWDVAYGANINDRVYLGMGGSILVSNYQIQNVFSETHLPYPYYLKDFSFTENDAHRGTGFTAKIGAIIKATDWVRVGVSVHSPTYNYMRETYSWGIVSNVYTDGPTTNLVHSDLKTTQNYFNYRLINPMRASAGLTLLAGKRGFITADAEFVPYQTASLQYPSNAFLFTADNTTIKNIYKNVFNYKVGAEVKMSKEFSLRGGFAYFADPYNHVDNTKRDQYNFTFGGGYRIEGFYIDFSVVQNFTNQVYKPYTLSNGQEPTDFIKNHYSSYQITTGFTF